jgi:predicted DNA binding protein
MDQPSTPKNQRVTSIQLDSSLGRTPSKPTSHYCSSTKITEAKANLKTILASRISYNDPHIVDVLIKPDEVNDELVQDVKEHILKDKKIRKFLNAVRNTTVKQEKDMYAPLVCRAQYAHRVGSCFE